MATTPASASSCFADLVVFSLREPLSPPPSWLETPVLLVLEAVSDPSSLEEASFFFSRFFAWIRKQKPQNRKDRTGTGQIQWAMSGRVTPPLFGNKHMIKT